MTEPSDFDHLEVLHAHLALHDEVIAKLEARAARPEASEDQKTTVAAVVALLRVDASLIAKLAEENATFRDQFFAMLEKLTKE